MTLTDILPSIRQLTALDKIHLVHLLAEEPDKSENVFPFQPHKIYYLPTPYNTYSTGKMLMDAMNAA